VTTQSQAIAKKEPAGPPAPPPRARAFCLDCGREVFDDDEAHQFHARQAISPRVNDPNEQVRSVSIDHMRTATGYRRIRTGIAGLDRVLGGGLVTNGVVVIDGPPGIGKSTLLASAAGRIAARKFGVLIASGEETVEQVQAFAHRIGHAIQGVRVISTQSLDEVFREVRVLEREEFHTDVLIVDSVQAMRLASLNSPTGSPWMVGAVADALRVHAKTHQRSIVAVSQVVKDGSMAGPKSMEHAVDCVLTFGRNETDTRFLRTKKNRFGPVGEVVQFEMSSRGLREIEDPSVVTWRDLVGESGVAGFVAGHLAKPVVVPVEALVSPAEEAGGSRLIQASGVSLDRVRFVLESLARHANVNFARNIVRVRVPQVAGEDVEDAGIDLAIAAACWSSLERVALGGMVFWGAVSLSGKLQTVGRVDARIDYAERVRATSIVAGHPRGVAPSARLPIVAPSHVSEFLDAINALRGRIRHDRQEEARRPEVKLAPAAPQAQPEEEERGEGDPAPWEDDA